MVSLVIAVLILLLILAAVHYLGAALGIGVNLRGLIMVVVIVVWLIFMLQGGRLAANF